VKEGVRDLSAAYRQLLEAGAWPTDAVRRIRDLLIIETAELALVVACDSNAATGNKPADALVQDPVITGYSAAKVPLMEVIAAGATPLILIDNLCCELEPTGRRILEGIEAALAETAQGVVLTGSDETNMPTVQTGVGVTVIGVVGLASLRLGTAQAGDAVVCIGTPKNGTTTPYREGDADIASVTHVASVHRSRVANELLPVGSRGVRYEAEQLAITAGTTIAFDGNLEVDVETSAGASTCFLAAVSPERLNDLRELTTLPTNLIGQLR
jgi:hypothetical protein